MKYPLNKLFVLFLCCHFVVWTLIPCLRSILPMDTMEAVVWGAMKEWGTNKHPPLSGWLAYGFWQGGFQYDMALYALSQFCIVIGLIYIYRIGRFFLSEQKALLATFLMEGILYYQFSSVEYNVNVLSLALWPLCTYYFLRAVNNKELLSWAFFGVFAGLNVLNKYVCVVLFLSFFLFLILTAEGRKCFKQAGLYLSALIGLVVVMPHIIWLYNTDFAVVDYFLGRGGSVQYHWSNHIFYPARFLITQLVFILPSALVYFGCCREKDKKTSGQGLILFFMGCLPLILTTLISLVLGTKLKTMWGYPLLYLSTVCLFYYVPRSIGPIQVKRLVKSSFILMLLFALGYVGQVAFNKGRNFQTDPQRVVSDLEVRWRSENPNRPLVAVGGHTWWASTLFVYHPDVRKVLYHLAPQNNPWFHLSDIQADGMLVLCDDEKEFQEQVQRYPTIKGPYLYDNITSNWFGKKSVRTLYYGFMKE